MAARATKADENGETRDPGLRISISVDPSLRRQMRIAAAINDMTVGEWANETLRRAVEKATEGIGK